MHSTAIQPANDKRIVGETAYQSVVIQPHASKTADLRQGSAKSHANLSVEEAPYWHLLPFSIFVVINALIWWLWQPDLVRLQALLTPFNLVLCGLAVYRIANIVSNEQVTRVLRAPFVDQEEEEEGHIVETPRPRGLKHTIGTLLYCPSCVGVWAAALIVYLLIFTPSIAWVAIATFALSACERIVTSVLQAVNSKA